MKNTNGIDLQEHTGLLVSGQCFDLFCIVAKQRLKQTGKKV